MLRGLLAAIAVLASASCTYRSAVDLAPFEQRSAFAQITPGTYCPVDRSGGATTGPEMSVNTGDCGQIIWDRATREYAFLSLASQQATPAEDEDQRFSALRLKPGLFLAQVRSGDANDAAPFEIVLFLATRDAAAVIDPLRGDPLLALALRHPKVTIGLADGRTEVLSGGREDIHRFLVDAAALSLKFQGETESGMSVLVRDPGNSPSRTLTGRQRAAIPAIDRLGAALARDAPDGIEAPREVPRETTTASPRD